MRTKVVNILKSDHVIDEVKTAKCSIKIGRYHLHSWNFPLFTPVGGGLGLFELISRKINDPRIRSWGLEMSWKSFS